VKFFSNLSPFSKVVAGLVLGILLGVFAGEPAGALEIVGNAYIRLLQMTVLPYILVSLISGLGRLDAKMAKHIGALGGSLILFLWLITLMTVLTMPFAYPDWTASAFFSASLVDEGAPFDPLTLYIPANPFFSLSNTIVPAVVLFSICLGLALIAVPDKDGLLRGLHNLSEALMRIASFVAKVAPLGIFAISAAAAGTLRLEELGRLQVYLWAYLGAWLVLAMVTLPMLVAWATPLSYRDVLREARVAMVTAFATGTVLVVLPMIAERCKELLTERELMDEKADSTVDVLVPTAYSFPSAGTLLGLAFILFAAWFIGSPLSPSQYPGYTVIGALSAFGTMAVALPFMLDFFRLPTDLFQLYLLGSVVTARFATALAAMHGVVICLLGACAMMNRMSWRRLFEVGAVGVAIAGIAMLILGFGLTRTIPYEYTGDKSFVAMSLAGSPVATVQVDTLAPLPAPQRDRPRLDVVRERGTLRVGYPPDRLPFAFRNSAAEVVGLDMDIINDLARDLRVTLEVVRLDLADAEAALEDGSIDLLVGGIAVTPARASVFAFTNSYLDQTLALIVRDHDRDSFANLSSVAGRSELSVAMMKSDYYEDAVRGLLPYATVTEVESPREFLRGELEDVDALVYSAETGAAWTLIYPRYSVIVPRGLSYKAPVGFALPEGQPELLSFLNTWFDLKQKNGVLKQFYEHWILGKDDSSVEPRWSVLRNVLGIGVEKPLQPGDDTSSTD